jgi:uncharacterized protein YkwD
MKKWKLPLTILAVILAIELSILLGFALRPHPVVSVQEQPVAKVEEQPTREAPLPEITPTSLLNELNERRTALGIAPLQLDARLNDSAQAKCDEMHDQDYYGHENPITSKHGYAIAEERLGLHGIYGENLSERTYKTNGVNVIFDGWFSSPTHKAAALNNRYTLTGFGICTAPPSEATSDYRTTVEHFYGP